MSIYTQHEDPIAVVECRAPETPQTEMDPRAGIAWSAAFVGDDVWIQRHHSLWRCAAGHAPEQIPVQLGGLRMFGARQRWLDFRCNAGWLSGRIGKPRGPENRHRTRY